MRAKEFIVEHTGEPHPEHDAVHQGFSKQRDPGGFYPTYHQYRTGMAIGMADGSNKPLDIDHESWVGPYWTFHPYTNEEHKMVKQVTKVIPTEFHQIRARTKSVEPDGTHKISPVSNWMNNNNK
jgi:hypothetical protein